METLPNNFITIYILSIITCLSYCYFISSKIPKGMYRFISLTPVLYIFTILPLRCTFAFTTALAFSFTTWLTNFKLVRFAFDLDESPYDPSYSLPRFIALTALPIKTPTYSTCVKTSRFKLGFQVAIYSILVKTLLNYRDQLHQNIISFMYGWRLFLIIDIVSGLVNSLVRFTTGLELEPSSNQPYLATSLQDFWGRWNIFITNTLRHTIYKPVTSAFSRYKWAPLAGILASFVVSGLMHEVFLYQLSREKPTWEMMSFFLVHGIAVVLEMVVKRGLGGRWRLPSLAGRLLTNGFVIVTGLAFFAPPLIRSRLDVKMLQEYAAFVYFIKTNIFRIQG